MIRLRARFEFVLDVSKVVLQGCYYEGAAVASLHGDVLVV